MTLIPQSITVAIAQVRYSGWIRGETPYGSAVTVQEMKGLDSPGKRPHEERL